MASSLFSLVQQPYRPCRRLLSQNYFFRWYYLHNHRTHSQSSSQCCFCDQLLTGKRST